MRVNESVDVAFVFRRQQWHVAVGAHHGVRRIVEGARALSGNAAGLPVIVFVEAAHPAIFIHGNVEMNFVAPRAEFRSLPAHERF